MAKVSPNRLIALLLDLIIIVPQRLVCMLRQLIFPYCYQGMIVESRLSVSKQHQETASVSRLETGQNTGMLFAQFLLC
jgi:hypothetical protein